MFLSIAILMTPNYGKRFHSKHKQCRPDQAASPEANCSESAVYWNIVWRSKVEYTTLLELYSLPLTTFQLAI